MEKEGELRILRATPDDVEAIYRLEQKVFDKNNYPMSKRSIRYHLKRDLFFVARMGNRHIGHMLLLDLKRYSLFRIFTFAVDKCCRREGIGMSMLLFAKQEAQKRGIQKLGLEVRVDNNRAISLYRKTGFKKTKVLKRFYLDGCDGLKMRARTDQI